MRRLVVLAAACGYRGGAPSEFYAQMPGEHVRFSCVELAVSRAHDAVAHQPVIQYAFGNHCAHRAMIDFTSLRVIARDAYGCEVPLEPYDPRHEIRPMPLPGGHASGERIEYDPPQGEQIGLAQVCVDVGRFAPGGEAHRWTCLPGESP